MTNTARKVLPQMAIVATRYGTFQVVHASTGFMIIESAKHRDCVEFVADPVQFGFGRIGGPN
jgi:hypothetical protein